MRMKHFRETLQPWIYIMMSKLSALSFDTLSRGMPRVGSTAANVGAGEIWTFPAERVSKLKDDSAELRGCVEGRED